MPGSRPPKATMWPPWTPTCRTRRPLLPQMLDALLTGDYDCAATPPHHPPGGNRRCGAGSPASFYRIINRLSDTEIVDGARDYRLMSRKMVDAVLAMAEYNRFSKGIFSWVGFNTKWFDYENVERVAGKTKWNFWGLFKYSIEGIVGFSTAALVMAAGAGVVFCLAAFVGILFVVVRALIFGDPTAGWTQHGLHHAAVQRGAAVLPGHCGRVSGPRPIWRSSTGPSTSKRRPRPTGTGGSNPL